MPARLAAPLAVLALGVALGAGCGDSSSDQDSTGAGSARSDSTSPPPANSPGAPVGAAAKSCDTHAVDAEGLRVSGGSCQLGRRVMYGWQRVGGCAPPQGASRSGCTAASYRCLSTRTERGVAVSCSRPGHSIAFVAERR